MTPEMKYIIVRDAVHQEYPIVFSIDLSHRDVARIHHVPNNIFVSAGFCRIGDTVEAYGHSETTGKSARPEDADIIKAHFISDTAKNADRRRYEIVRDILARQPFCPDHRDKVRDLPCRQCEIEHLAKAIVRLHSMVASYTLDSDYLPFIKNLFEHENVKRALEAKEDGERSISSDGADR